jgi:hypothetical protein
MVGLLFRLGLILFAIERTEAFFHDSLIPTYQELPVISYFYKGEIQDRENAKQIALEKERNKDRVVRSSCKFRTGSIELGALFGMACKTVGGDILFVKNKTSVKDLNLDWADAPKRRTLTQGKNCKKFTAEGSSSKVKTGTACKDKNGNWKVVSSR